VCEGRENRKKSTAPTLVSENRFYGALRSVKKAPFLTYTVKNAEEAPTARGEKSPGKISTSPGLVATSPGLVATRGGGRFPGPII
jgi:hypothetical protein